MSYRELPPHSKREIVASQKAQVSTNGAWWHERNRLIARIIRSLRSLRGHSSHRVRLLHREAIVTHALDAGENITSGAWATQHICHEGWMHVAVGFGEVLRFPLGHERKNGA